MHGYTFGTVYITLAFDVVISKSNVCNSCVEELVDMGVFYNPIKLFQLYKKNRC